MLLAKKLADALEVGSSLFSTIDFKRHLVNSYITRLEEMNTPLGRLALFLDPRFKELILSADTDKKEMRVLFNKVWFTHAYYSPGVALSCLASASHAVATYGTSFQVMHCTSDVVINLHSTSLLWCCMPQAMTIMQNRDRSKDEIVRLGQQLLHYNASIAPFCQQKGGADFVPRMWWSALSGGDKVDIFRALAMMLFDVVPHIATTERTFSIAGWMRSKTRNRMSVSSTGKLAAIKLHCNAQRPSLPPQRSQAAAEKRKMAHAAAGDDLREAAIERGEVELIEP
jgi:hypothetical protein